MAWGDSWGSTPRSNALRLAKAFFEGRDLGSVRSGTYVAKHFEDHYMEYYCRHCVIARYTPPEMLAQAVADTLTGNQTVTYPTMQFRCSIADKAEARHLQALGVDARCPFLAFGADISDCAWRTIEECKALPEWEPPKSAPVVRRERFINLTLPLFTA